MGYMSDYVKLQVDVWKYLIKKNVLKVLTSHMGEQKEDIFKLPLARIFILIYRKHNVVSKIFG